MEQTLTPEKQKVLLAIGAVLQAAGPGQLRAVAYLRVSTEEQKKGYGIAYTGKRVVKHIAKKGWALVDVFADEGVSGSLDHTQRPDLGRLMALARQKPRAFDVVVVQEDRAIGRQGRAFWPWVWELEDLGVFTAVVKGDYDNTTDDGRSRMRKAQDRAEDELVTIRDRTQGGLQEKAEDGGYTGGNVPFGWRIENQGKKGESRLVLDAGGEHVTLAKGRELAVKHRGDWREVARELNALGMYTRSGVPWSRENARTRITSHAALHAEVVFRNTNSKDKKSGRGAKTDREGNTVYGETVRIPIPPAFSDEELEELRQAVKYGKAGRPKRASAEIYPLSERLHSVCGGYYVGQKQTLSGQRWYRCNGKQERYVGAPVCRCNGIPASLVETELWDLLVQVLSDPQKLQEAAAEYLEMTADQAVNFEDRIKDLDKQIEVQQRAIKATMAVTAKMAAMEGKEDREIEAEVESAVAPLMAEKAKLEKLRAEVVQWQAESEAAQGRVRDLRKLAETARRRLHKLTLSEQAEVLGLLDLKVRIKEAPPAAPKGAACPVRTWFEEKGRKVPVRVSDASWAAIQPLVSAGDRPCRAGQRFDHRTALEGILHKARTGAKWDDVPLSQGTGKGLSSRFRRWRESGMWDQIMELLDSEEVADLPEGPKLELPKMEVEGGFILQELLGSLSTSGGTLPSGSIPPHVIRFRFTLAA